MLNSKSIELSIIIVSYNVQELLLTCLHSLQRFVCKNITTEIIVIDNHSLDDSCIKIKELFPEVILIENSNNLGFSAANNQGFSLARGNFILMLNPDTEMVDNSIEKALTFFQTQKEKSILLGAGLLYGNKTKQVSCWKFPKVANHLLELLFLSKWMDFCSYKNLDYTTEVDAVSGAVILMRKETLNRLNGLDEYLFWMDDIDLCKRNRDNGGSTVYFPEFRVIHHIGQSAKKNQKVAIANQIISKLKYYKKHRQYKAFYLSCIVFYLQIISRMIVFTFLGWGSSSYKEKAHAYAYIFRRYPGQAIGSKKVTEWY
jgi:GT2 family glycosyltransferase